MSSPRSRGSSPSGSPRSPGKNNALNNELAHAKRAISVSPPSSPPYLPLTLRQVLKQEKENEEAKVLKLHKVLEKERADLREVLEKGDHRSRHDYPLLTNTCPAQNKVAELKKIKKEQEEEIERLKKLICAPGSCRPAGVFYYDLLRLNL